MGHIHDSACCADQHTQPLQLGGWFTQLHPVLVSISFLPSIAYPLAIMICPSASVRYPQLIIHHSRHNGIPNPACDCDVSYEYSLAGLTRIASGLCMQLGRPSTRPPDSTPATSTCFLWFRVYACKRTVKFEGSSPSMPTTLLHKMKSSLKVIGVMLICSFTPCKPESGSILDSCSYQGRVPCSY